MSVITTRGAGVEAARDLLLQALEKETLEVLEEVDDVRILATGALEITNSTSALGQRLVQILDLAGSIRGLADNLAFVGRQARQEELR